MCVDTCGRDGCFEGCCCFKCTLSLSPCLAGCCTWCKCFSWCKNCCPCLCWPPRQCMAFFLGLFGFVVMLICVSSESWVIFAGNGAGPPIIHVDTNKPVLETSWGFWAGAVRVGDEWFYEAMVKEDFGRGYDGPEKAYEFDSKRPDWVGQVGSIVCVGELSLLIGLVIVFLGLCSCCCANPSGRNKLFRCGMYFYLLADLIFFASLIYIPYGFGAFRTNANLSVNIGSYYGWGWGVVINVFTGALLLLLDKAVGPVDDVEAEKLL